jgi:hypothetical protein
MKNVLPKTKLEWMRFFLIPFKFWIFLFPLIFVGLMIEGGSSFVDRNGLMLEFEGQIHLMIAGYILSIIILIAGAIFAAITARNWKLMRSGLIYAGIGLFVLTMFILPSLAATRS